MSTSSKLPISVLILTHINDQRFFDCLKSCKFAEEILVLDNNSQNNWSALKKKFLQLKVKQQATAINNFSQVRNQLLDQAQHDWVLVLDSDERLVGHPGQLKALLKQALNQHQYQGFYLNRQDLFKGQTIKHAEAGQQRLLRLFNKKQTKFIRPVHEVAECQGKTGKLPLTIIHQAHQNISQFLQDINRYAQLEAQFRWQSNNRPNYILVLAQLLLFPGLKFVVNYLLKLGFLDGMPGLIYAAMMSLHSALVRIYLLEFYTDGNP